MDPLTDLEAAAIGCVIACGRCTAHFIRTRFGVSATARYSASAGSIYPMMRRLEQRGLLEGAIEQEGRRDVRYYTPNTQGRKALRAWLSPPSDELAMLSFDHLRTRMLYLGLLTASQRTLWFEQVGKGLEQTMCTIEKASEHAEHPDVYVELANENARLATKARIKWLAQARKRLVDEGLLSESTKYPSRP